ncbi:MAG: amidase domain-containing protein [Desulfotomaculales bacterium]
MNGLRILLLPLLALLTWSLTAADCIPVSTTPVPEELNVRVQDIFAKRARALLTGADPGPVLEDYDTGSKLGRWALSHEQNKLNFVQLWAQKRGVRFVEAEPALRIPWSRVRGDTAEFLVHQTLRLGYVYPGDTRVNNFGIGTRHALKLVRKDGRWLVRQDFYTDGLGDDTLVPHPVPADGAAVVAPPAEAPPARGTASGAFDREGAVRYADRYAGLAWGAGNDHKYNPRYRDLTGIGGDCTNFVSQCLGDAEGGRLPMDGAWYYRRDRWGGSGSRAWVQTEAFARWLLDGGRARLVARGTFPELNGPNAKFPRGAVRELQKGDVIGYEEKGRIEHFAIVVGTDTHGYPVVNAHTVDRYHSPWDMGWDRQTVFHLFQIHD